ncbi:uncharacterized protein B0H18DRAFT_1024711 [Fomitopsis serialis]|uniref:uncharacterized protein n=1 Tax=Fomitopsis serialis TaxID=139415 RepID=UPI002008486D|nr:uncharacterized protein B0H18DRAFT_1024711 [Neoantrodia serialis]KAH9920297.1 hypothetical protein B0H18DRAFT_1024711 [Neoantrodia serialis]
MDGDRSPPSALDTLPTSLTPSSTVYSLPSPGFYLASLLTPFVVPSQSHVPAPCPPAATMRDCIPVSHRPPPHQSLDPHTATSHRSPVALPANISRPRTPSASSHSAPLTRPPACCLSSRASVYASTHPQLAHRSITPLTSLACPSILRPTHALAYPPAHIFARPPACLPTLPTCVLT